MKEDLFYSSSNVALLAVRESGVFQGANHVQNMTTTVEGARYNTWGGVDCLVDIPH